MKLTMLLLSAITFVIALVIAFLPLAPKPAPDVSTILRQIAGELSDKYWLVLLAGGLIGVWRRRELLLTLILTLVVSQVAIELLQFSVGEMRPDGESFDSFPSGHTTTSFAFATVMANHFPRWGLLWFIFAVMVGISRVIVNAHWWQDIIGGAALGYLIAFIMQALLKR